MPPDADPATPAVEEAVDADRQRIAWLHERSGEVELLISGALLVGLLQVPGRLSAAWGQIGWSLDEQTFILGFLLYFYARMMVFTLIAGFGLHLVTRAYWVGLVGLDSVFPEGIDWSQVRYGPVAKKVYSDRLPSLPHLARRADDVGSAIFSVSFWIVTIFLYSVAFALVFGGVSWAISPWLLPSVSPAVILVAFALVFGSIPIVTIGLEQLLGSRLDPEGRLARAITRLLAAFYRVSGGALYLPIQFTLFSRIPKRVVWPASVAVFVGFFAVLIAGERARVSPMGFSASALLPARPGARAIALQHFEDTRAPNGLAPYIQSDVIEGPYVRLTIPLVPAAYAARLAAVCPDLEPLGASGLVGPTATDDPPDPGGEARLLDCLGRIWLVRLDGRSLQIDWDYVWSAATGTRALVAYLPTGSLRPGPHLLRIERIPDPESEEAEPSVAVHLIRFRV